MAGLLLDFRDRRIGGDDSKGLLCNLILMLAKVSRGDYASCLGKGCRSGRKW